MRFAVCLARNGWNGTDTTFAVLWAPVNVDLNEISVYFGATPSTNAADWYLVRATARGDVNTFQAGNVLDGPLDSVSQATVDAGWGSTGPTLTAKATAAKRSALPTTAGVGFTWSFRNFDVPEGSGVALVNANASGSTTGSFLLNFEWSEYQ